LTKELVSLGYPVDPAHGNFILARFEDQAEAEAADLHLRSRGIIVRKVLGYKLPDSLRISIGDEDACRAVAQAMAAFR
jgi:histidinol-phosphate aminotransferase